MAAVRDGSSLVVSAMGWYAKNYYVFTTVVSVARDKILTNLIETHSDIWMLHVD